MSDRDTAPAEGLPPCVSLVRLDNRMAALVDYAVCKHVNSFRFSAMASYVNDEERLPNGFWHPEFPPWQARDVAMDILTDDPAEAQAAFERGAKWARTGEGP